MKKIAQGLPLKKYIGNKHKDGGIMVNALGNKTKDVNKAVAEVEGGEYNFRYDSTNPMNNYIIPARETFPKVNDMAKQADRFKGNNRIDYNTRTNLLNKSMKLNEMLRVQQEQQQPMQMALGGGLKDVNPFDKQPPKQKDSNFRKIYQSTPMNVAKMFDPTGISSYPDVAYSIDDYNKGKGSKSDIALNVLGALPIIGKAKPLITFAKGTSKSKKVLNTVTKLGDLAGDIERFPTKVAKDFTEGARKPIAKLVNKSTTNLLNFNDVIRNTIVPPLNPKRIPTKSATKSDMINAGTSIVNMGNLGSDINSISKKQFGGKLKKYSTGSFLLKGSQSIVDSMVANSKANDTTKIATAPEIKLGTTTAPKLETNPIKLPTLPTTTPKTTAEAANTGMQVNTQNDATPEPTINKKGVKDITSGLSGVASAFGPIGQGIGAAIQLAPYAIDLGKAMFDKTSVQDLQTQGSAMRLPNTTYAKHGGKLNVKPLPVFKRGGLKIDKKSLAGDNSYLDKKFTTQNYIDYSQEKADEISRTNAGVTDKMYRSLSKFFNTPADFDPYFKSNSLNFTSPVKTNTQTPTNVVPNSATTTSVKSNPLKVTPISKQLNSYPVSTPGNEILYQPTTVTNNVPVVTNSTTQKIGDYSFDTTKLTPLTDLKTKLDKGEITEKDMVYITEDDRAVVKNPDGTYKFKETTMDEDSDIRIRNAFKTGINTLTTLPTTIKSTKPGVNNLTTLDVKKEMDIAKKAGLNVVPQPSESESSRLYKAGQTKQKLSEALMYGMAALPSEQIKTITPDYGRGDDAMSRMGLSTEPIRQEMMQGANKALELTRSQVGTAGQLQSRGQSIMSNVGSQLAQSQIQQQQYLNQLRAALAQREDTKANVLAQSELTAREARSAERAAKLDQLNNAISQTSAIGAGTMEQASKMSTIENENERFNRSQKNLLDLGNKSTNLKVIQNKDGTISYDFTGSTLGQSTIQTPSLATTPAANNAANTGTNTTPASNVVVPAATTTGSTYTIKKGDTLYAIAKANNTTVSNLVKANNFKNDKALILPGQTIKIK